MKIGDYVRTEYGISKITGIYPNGTMIFIETDNGLGDYTSIENGKIRKGILILEEDYINFIDNHIKEKPIDLIEVGDYVNKKEITNLSKSIGGGTIALNTPDSDIDIFEKDIKTIVTKEQFENVEYIL